MDISDAWPDSNCISHTDNSKVFTYWLCGTVHHSVKTKSTADMLSTGGTVNFDFYAQWSTKQTPTSGDKPGELDVLNGASDPAGNFFEVVVNHHLRYSADGADVNNIQTRQFVNLTTYKKLIATADTDRAALKDAEIFPDATYHHLIQQASNGNKTFTDTTTTKPYTLYSYTRKYYLYHGQQGPLRRRHQR